MSVPRLSEFDERDLGRLSRKMSKLSHYSFLKKKGVVEPVQVAAPGADPFVIDVARMQKDREQQRRVFDEIEGSDYYKRIAAAVRYNRHCYLCGVEYVDGRSDKFNYGNCRFCYMTYLYCTRCWMGTRCPECNGMCTRTSSINACSED